MILYKGLLIFSIFLLFSCEIPDLGESVSETEIDDDPVSVILNSQSEILDFSFPAIDDECFIDGQRIYLIVPSGTDLSDLTPEISLSPGAVLEVDTSVSGLNNYTSKSKHYVVTAEDGSVKHWWLYIIVHDPADTSYDNKLTSHSVTCRGIEISGTIDNINNIISLTLPYGTPLDDIPSHHFCSPSAVSIPGNGGRVDLQGGKILVIGGNGQKRTYTFNLTFEDNTEAELDVTVGSIQHYVDYKINRIYDIPSEYNKSDLINSLIIPFGADLTLFQPDYRTVTEDLQNGCILRSMSEDGLDVVDYFLFSDTYETPLISYSGSDYTLSVTSTGNICFLQISDILYEHWKYDNLNYLDFTDLSKILYEYYNDDFDFLIFNGVETPYYDGQKYSGLTYNVKNEVTGINYNQIDNTSQYGSEGKLQCVIYFPDYIGLYKGPSLHEIGHHWAGHWDILDDPYHHWGFSSGGGQLGGWSDGTLTDLGGGEYQAHYRDRSNFATGNLQGNFYGYSELELYCMGLIDAGEVSQTLEIAGNAQWIDSGNGIFRADSMDSYTIDDITDLYGPRTPSVTDSQKAFKALYTVISDKPFDKELMQKYEMNIIRFSAEKNLESGSVMSFYQATGGRATFDFLDSYTSLK